MDANLTVCGKVGSEGCAPDGVCPGVAFPLSPKRCSRNQHCARNFRRSADGPPKFKGFLGYVDSILSVLLPSAGMMGMRKFRCQRGNWTCYDGEAMAQIHKRTETRRESMLLPYQNLNSGSKAVEQALDEILILYNLLLYHN